MAQQTIAIGTTANDGTGDTLRAAGTKINANFTELYGMLAVGTWTPTLTNGANVAASTPRLCHYMRVGTKVHCWGTLDVDPTAAANTATVLEMSLPIASNFAATTDLAGVTASASAQRAGVFSASIANDRAVLSFASEVTPNTTFAFSFAYTII